MQRLSSLSPDHLQLLEALFAPLSVQIGHAAWLTDDRWWLVSIWGGHRVPMLCTQLTLVASPEGPLNTAV